MSLDPDIAALLEMVQAGMDSGARVPFPKLTPSRARADFEASSPLLDADPPPLAHECRLSLPMRDGNEIAARVYSQKELDPSRPIRFA
jgi:acetyl esterase